MADRDLAVSDVQEVSVPREFVKLTQRQCQELRGDTICARCACELRGHVWGWGTVGECRLHGGACDMFVIDQDFTGLRDSQVD